MKILLVLIGMLSIIAADQLYKKVIHNYDPQAKCLDGSPGLLYVHEGGDKQNILIFFYGGGLCGQQTIAKTLESCYQRSKTLLGSSNYWPEQMPGEGYLSTNPAVNRFANWTKFLFGYCDGSLHQGYTANPIKYKDTELYFRGSALTRSHFNWINSKYDLNNAEKIVLTGMSAGGVAVHLWNNYLRSIVKNKDAIYSIDDSGVFLNLKSVLGNNKIEKQIANTYAVANVNEATPFSDCNTLNKGEQWRCLFIQYGYTALKGKYLIINSQYDAWAIPNILQVGCLKKGIAGQTLTGCNKVQIEQIQKYRSAYKSLMTSFLVGNPSASIWSIACSNHVYACLNLFYDSPLQRIPAVIGSTIKTAVELFVFNNERVINYDAQPWPSNIVCAKMIT